MIRRFYRMRCGEVCVQITDYSCRLEARRQVRAADGRVRRDLMLLPEKGLVRDVGTDPHRPTKSDQPLL